MWTKDSAVLEAPALLDRQRIDSSRRQGRRHRCRQPFLQPLPQAWVGSWRGPTAPRRGNRSSLSDDRPARLHSLRFTLCARPSLLFGIYGPALRPIKFDQSTWPMLPSTAMEPQEELKQLLARQETLKQELKKRKKNFSKPSPTNRRRPTVPATTREPWPDGRGPGAPVAPSSAAIPGRAAARLMRELAAAPDRPLYGTRTSRTLRSGWPVGSPLKPARDDAHKRAVRDRTPPYAGPKVPSQSQSNPPEFATKLAARLCYASPVTQLGRETVNALNFEPDRSVGTLAQVVKRACRRDEFRHRD